MTERRIKELASQTQFGYGQYADIIQNKDDIKGRVKRAKAHAERLLEFVKKCEYLLAAVEGVEFIGRTPVRRIGNMLERTTRCIWDNRVTVRKLLHGHKNNKFSVEGRNPGEEDYELLVQDALFNKAKAVEDRFYQDVQSPDKDER